MYWGTSIDTFYVNEKSETDEILMSLGIVGPYFLSISCAHPRKNIKTLLHAYRKFREVSFKLNRKHCLHKLVLVWNNPPQEILDEFSKEIDEGSIVFLGSLSDKNIRALYCGATCTMFPTLAEGFGFPILESFACGTPVMTCKNTSIPEVGRDAAIYVGERDIDSMSNVMEMFEKGEYDMTKFYADSNRVIDSFSWENTAQKYIDFYMKYI